MRISIREALFGGEELDDWEPTRSKWIAVFDNHYKFTDEIRALGIIDKEDRLPTPNGYAVIHDDGDLKIHSGSFWTIDRDVYYNQDINFTVKVHTINKDLKQKAFEALENMELKIGTTINLK